MPPKKSSFHLIESMKIQSSMIEVDKLNLQVYEHQVSGKTPKFTDKSERYIYKSYSESEGKFF